MPLSRGLVVGSCHPRSETLHHPDILPMLDSEFPDAKANQTSFGFSALLAVPLMRGGSRDRRVRALAHGSARDSPPSRLRW